MSCYQCQGCSRILDWDTDVQHPDPDRAEVKSIASRFCQDCIWLDADGQGLSIDLIVAGRLLSRRPLRIDEELRSAMFALHDENPRLFVRITRCLFERARFDIPIGRAPRDIDDQLGASLAEHENLSAAAKQKTADTIAAWLESLPHDVAYTSVLAMEIRAGHWKAEKP